ncbi:phage tail tube protein [Streptomyces sp. NPDC004838]
MAGDTDNPRLWEGADLYAAPVGSTAPTDTTTAWAAAWKAAGLLSEDGASESRDQDSTDHYAWGGVLVRTTRGKHKRQIKVTCLEDNLVVFGLVNPGSTAVTTTGTTTRTVKVPTSDPRAFGLELRDGDIVKRRVIPKGEVDEVGEVTLSDSELTAYELTITVYPAADKTLYIDITDDPQAVVTP